MPQDAEWKTLAEEAAQEKDPDKLLEIVLSLVAAIDKEQSKNTPHLPKEQTRTSTAPAA